MIGEYVIHSHAHVLQCMHTLHHHFHCLQLSGSAVAALLTSRIFITHRKSESARIIYFWLMRDPNNLSEKKKDIVRSICSLCDILEKLYHDYYLLIIKSIIMTSQMYFIFV